MNQRTQTKETICSTKTPSDTSTVMYHEDIPFCDVVTIGLGDRLRLARADSQIAPPLSDTQATAVQARDTSTLTKAK